MTLKKLLFTSCDGKSDTIKTVFRAIEGKSQLLHARRENDLGKNYLSYYSFKFTQNLQYCLLMYREDLVANWKKFL
jgi:hypothetical protein